MSTITSKGKTAIRRRVRRDFQVGDQVGFKTKSFTKNDGTEYHPVIDKATGEFSCDCPDHVYRKRCCKHIQRAAAQLKSELAPSAPHCCNCHSLDNLYGLCREDGTAIRGSFMCRSCSQTRREQVEQWDEEALVARAEIDMLEARRDVLERMRWEMEGEREYRAYHLRKVHAQLMNWWGLLMAMEPRSTD